MTEARGPVAGDWCVISRLNDFHPRVTVFEAARAERVTAKLVYAKAFYRTQHPIEAVMVMPNEGVARVFEARARSAFAEAIRRERAAWEAYNKAIGEISASGIVADEGGRDAQRLDERSEQSPAPKGGDAQTSEVNND